MDFPFPAMDKIKVLLDKGVKIPSPYSMDIGQEVNVDRISGDGVVLYPGCRIYGDKTCIGPGTKLGYEAPVTVDNCWISAGVKLKGGFFNEAVFLEKSNMGLGAHVRKGSILEEEANGAHCVGLKQTILLPFVTLGSLVNFCDCLMAGGTSRKDHSEVGSSFIHFNYTPDQDKTTPSLIGDVPKGVMLNQRPIFLGGQGGMVGPLQIGYGNVTAAGTILRKDIPQEGKIVIEAMSKSFVRNFTPCRYPTLKRTVERNLQYIANLIALQNWYTHVRKPFLQSIELGAEVYQGAMASLDTAIAERIKRLDVLGSKMEKSISVCGEGDPHADRKRELKDGMEQLKALLSGGPGKEAATGDRDAFLEKALNAGQRGEDAYVSTIQQLPEEVSAQGTRWLQAVVDQVLTEAWKIIPGFDQQ